MSRIICMVTLSVLALVSLVGAQSVPQSIKIQGYLSDKTGGTPVPANGSFNMLFEIFDAPAGGAPLATAGPTAVTVTNGVYEASISVAASVFAGSSRYLQVTVNGELLSPRLPIDSTPFALRSEVAVKAETVAPGSVGVAGLADGSVTAPKIGVPCAEGQILLRTGGVWTCAALPGASQICVDGSFLSCYTGPAGTLNVGTCRAGVSACKADHSGFDTCTGSVTPVAETCDTLDNDCDGQVDEGVCVGPTVTTSAPTSVTTSSATLNGSANPNSDATTGWFRYSLVNPGTCNDTFGSRVPGSGGTSLGSGSSAVPYSQAVSSLSTGATYYVCAIASNSQGTSFGAVVSFTTVASAPTVTTSAATSVAPGSATLNGSANPNGGATTGWFRYSTTNPGACDDTFGTRAPSSGGASLGSGATAVAYAQAVSGLVPGTTYYACAIASNPLGTSFGSVVSFATPVNPPTVTTGAATLVTSSSATLNGSASPNGDATTGWFRYSTTSPGTCNDSFGTRAPASGGSSLGSGGSAVAYSQSISGLVSGTTYYVCALASNALGTSFGTVVAFTTTSPPTVATSPTTAVLANSAMLNGFANPNGDATTGWFRYSTTNPGTCNDAFGTRAPSSGGSSLGSGHGVVAYSQSVAGLATGTTYYACAIAGNSVGTSFGGVTSFTTPTPPTVTTLAATQVFASGAVLHATINANGSNGTFWFRYGPVNPGTCNDTFGSQTPASPIAGSAPQSQSWNIGGLTPATTYYACVIASNAGGTSFGGIVSFATPDSQPTVTTSAATLVTSFSATLNGSANPQAHDAIGYFRYDTVQTANCDELFGTRVPASGGVALGSGTSSVPFSVSLSGLVPGTTYYYCAFASNSVGSDHGSFTSFTTPAPPAVTTLAATSVTSSSATLRGSADPNGAATTGWFRFSTTNPGACNDTFGTRAPSSGGSALGSGSSPVAYSQAISSLAAGTTYYFCAIAQNSEAISFGAVLSFTTP